MFEREKTQDGVPRAAVAPKTRLLNYITCLTRQLFNRTRFGAQRDVLAEPLNLVLPYPPPLSSIQPHKIPIP